jgi:hypothetical protein
VYLGEDYDKNDGNSSDDGVAAAYRPTSQGTNPIAYETWNQMGFQGYMALPFYDEEAGEVRSLVHGSEDAKMCNSILEKSPGRKRGRPKTGKEKNSTERSRKHRSKHRKEEKPK